MGLDRQSFVVVVGGGAVLDMVSFAAAIAHRGVRVVRFPTTVLSQADSGVAVKNGCANRSGADFVPRGVGVLLAGAAFRTCRLLVLDFLAIEYPS